MGAQKEGEQGGWVSVPHFAPDNERKVILTREGESICKSDRQNDGGREREGNLKMNPKDKLWGITIGVEEEKEEQERERVDSFLILHY